MKLIDIFELNDDITKSNQFTKAQWEEIINIAFSADRSFNHAVETFYVEMLEFDYEDCEDLVADIQSGDEDAFKRFIDDIIYYFENE